MHNTTGSKSPRSAFLFITFLTLTGALCPGLGLAAGSPADDGSQGRRAWDTGRILELGAGQDGVGPRGDDDDGDDTEDGGRVLELGAGENGRLLEFGAGESGLVGGILSWILSASVR